MSDPRELLQVAERRYRVEHCDHLQPATQTRCPCPHYASRHRGAGVEVRCATSVGGAGCGFWAWWPESELATKAVA